MAEFSLEGSKGIKKLLLEGNRNISSVGWGAIGRYIGSPHSLLGELTLNTNCIDNDSIVTLADGLVTNTTLKNLSICSVESTSPIGWQAFFNRLCGSNLALLELDLSYIDSIDDDAIASMLSWLSNMPSLKRLCINEMTTADDTSLITKVGWLRFSSLISNSSLTRLDLDNNYNIDDEVIISYASALSNNNTLEFLVVEGYFITAKGWNALTNALCNKSLEGIIASNHTLQGIGDGYNVTAHGRVSYPELDSLLQLNRNDNKAEVVRQKIIRYYFCDGSSNVEKFLGMDWEVLPKAISWIGGNNGLSLLYRFFCSMPSLFDSESKAKSIRVKRKRHELRRGENTWSIRFSSLFLRM